MNKQLQDVLKISVDRIVPSIKKLAEKAPPDQNPLKSQKHTQEMFLLRCDEGAELFKKRVQKGYDIIVHELKKHYH